METSQAGFSLAELLVTLLLISATSFMLLEQQSQVHQLLHRALQRSFASTLIDNYSERLMVGLPLNDPPEPFKLKQTSMTNSLIFEIFWGFDLPNSLCCKLERQALVQHYG